MMKILVINGPNINLLGIREPQIYGTETYADLCRRVEAHAARLGARVELFQSNHEGDLVDKIQSALGTADGIILNPAAYTHTSIAILDAVKAVGVPTVAVHLTDTASREPFRAVSYVRSACVKTIMGHGIAGYLEALDYLCKGAD
jgi:3-dehydroquinate dehydratase-2